MSSDCNFLASLRFKFNTKIQEAIDILLRIFVYVQRCTDSAMVADVISSHGAKDRDKENHFIQNYGIDDVSGITQRDVVSDSIANLTSLISAEAV